MSFLESGPHWDMLQSISSDERDTMRNFFTSLFHHRRGRRFDALRVHFGGKLARTSNKLAIMSCIEGEGESVAILYKLNDPLQRYHELIENTESDILPIQLSDCNDCEVVQCPLRAYMPRIAIDHINSLPDSTENTGRARSYLQRLVKSNRKLAEAYALEW